MMKGRLVDSNVILDIFLNDPKWASWSESTLAVESTSHHLYINPIVYSEVSIGFDKIEDLEKSLKNGGFQMLDLPREALFLAGKAFQAYKRNQGTKRSPLPDFYIGAHAGVLGIELITRDISRYRTYCPTVRLISPSE
jgi:predicted nucleic acid-binding protein